MRSLPRGSVIGPASFSISAIFARSAAASIAAGQRMEAEVSTISATSTASGSAHTWHCARRRAVSLSSSAMRRRSSISVMRRLPSSMGGIGQNASRGPAALDSA